MSRRGFLSQMWDLTKTASGLYLASAVLDTDEAQAQTTQPKRIISVNDLPIAPEDAVKSKDYTDRVNFGRVPLYDVRKHREIYIAKNFQVHEFNKRSTLANNKDGSLHDDFIRLDPNLVTLLQNTRDLVGPIDVVSGYRSNWYNNYLRSHGVKASKLSQHTSGRAADCKSKLPIRELADIFAQELAKLGIRGGIGVYDTFVHVDTAENVGRKRKPSRRWGNHIAKGYHVREAA